MGPERRSPLIPASIRMALSAATMMAIAIGAYAQAGPTFEVSSLGAVQHGFGSSGGSGRMSRTPQRIAFQAALLGNIMAFAYGLPLDRIERRPQWMYDELYGVAVTTAAPTALAEQKLLLQKLLEERFGLMVHRVSNPTPVYFLLIPAGAKPNLAEAKDADPEGRPEFRMALGTLVGRNVSMADLADWLCPQLQLPVLDKTGMTGLFDIEIPGLPINGAERTIRAVRNALGLDLELHPGSAESLIIDQVKKPEQN